MKWIKRIVLIGVVLGVAYGGWSWWRSRGLPPPDGTPGETALEKPAMTVRVAEARTGDVQAWIFAEGTARSTRREYLTFQNAGRIAWMATGDNGEELRAGDAVNKGELLAYQDQRRVKADLATARTSLIETETQAQVAQAEIQRARTDYELAQTTFHRYEALREKNSASAQEYDEAKTKAQLSNAAVEQARSRLSAAQAQIEAAQARIAQVEVSLEETELRAPIDGIVAYLNIEEGYYHNPSYLRTDSESAALQTVPIVIIDPSEFEVTVDVPSFQSQLLSVGQVALIDTGQDTNGGAPKTKEDEDQATWSSIAQLPKSPVRGEVYSVSPAVNPGARTVQVKVRTTGETRRLEDGKYVTAWIATEAQKNVVVAPMGVFLYRDNEPYVYVVDPATRAARQRRVELGLAGLDAQEIRSGVKAGELLVTDGRFQLSDGALVQMLGAESTGKAEPGND
jgi:RND family efflux transporter MFP subunit